MSNIVNITTTSFAEFNQCPLEALRSRGLEIRLNPHRRKLEKRETVEFCKDAVGIIAGTEGLDADVITQLKNLKVISRCGAGLDNVDLVAAKKLGIKVFNTPDAPSLSVAELTVGLILNLLRKVNQMDNAVREGKWKKLMGSLLSGKKVGLIGFGRIGRKVAGLLMPFDCKVKYYDKKRIKVKGLSAIQSDLDKLLKTSEIISVHISSKEQIIGEREIRLMPNGAYLVNVSRGEAVDEYALYNAIKEGRLSGAALDVFEVEPYTGILKELNNVILTPHIGSYAKEGRMTMELQAVENLLKGLEDTL